MVWTPPKTWATGEVLSSNDMNLYVRDNTDYLKTEVDAIGGDNSYLYAGRRLFTSTGTFVKADAFGDGTDTSWLRLLRVTMVGGGGAGGGAIATSSGETSCGGGGGSGWYIQYTILASTLDASEAVTVGVGGVGQIGLDGTDATGSSFNGRSAGGGAGGDAAASAGSLGIGGFGGVGSSPVNGLVVGGAYGHFGQLNLGGAGASNPIGNGGRSGNPNQGGNGADGTGYGSGGGGAGNGASATAKAGGDGADGAVLLEFYR